MHPSPADRAPPAPCPPAVARRVTARVRGTRDLPLVDQDGAGARRAVRAHEIRAHGFTPMDLRPWIPATELSGRRAAACAAAFRRQSSAPAVPPTGP